MIYENGYQIHDAICEKVPNAILINAFKNNPKLINSSGRRQFGPLAVACAEGNLELVQYLVKNGANTNPEKRHPIIALCLSETVDQAKKIEIIKLLQEHKSNINLPYNYQIGGETKTLTAVDCAELSNDQLVKDYLTGGTLDLSSAESFNLDLDNLIERLKRTFAATKSCAEHLHTKGMLNRAKYSEEKFNQLEKNINELIARVQNEAKINKDPILKNVITDTILLLHNPTEGISRFYKKDIHSLTNCSSLKDKKIAYILLAIASVAITISAILLGVSTCGIIPVIALATIGTVSLLSAAGMFAKAVRHKPICQPATDVSSKIQSVSKIILSGR